MKKLFDISNKKIYCFYSALMILAGVLGAVGFYGTTRFVFCLVAILGILSLFHFDKMTDLLLIAIGGIVIFILLRFLFYGGDSPFFFIIYVLVILFALLSGFIGIKKDFLGKESNKKLFILLNIIAVCFFCVSVIYYFSLIVIGSWYGGRWLLLRGAYYFFTFISMMFLNAKNAREI